MVKGAEMLDEQYIRIRIIFIVNKSYSGVESLVRQPPLHDQ